MTRRRAFVKQMAGAMVGGAVLDQIVGIRRAFGAEVDRLGLERHTAASFPQMRNDYLLDPDVTYLNHASIGTIPRAVHRARQRYLDLCETNPWLYMWGGAWEEAREHARGQTAALMRCDPADVAITHNTTEAFNLLAQGLPLGAGDEVLFSSLNHDGASVAFFHAARSRGFTVKRFQFPVLDVPAMTNDDILAIYDDEITPRTRLIVFPHVDNMVGLRHPVRELAAQARARGVEFVAVDAAQTVGMIPVDVGHMGVDLYATSPHKWLQAPKGLGLAYVAASVRETLRPLWVTWGQNRWQGSARIYEDYGTRNLAEVLTLGDAVDFQHRMNDEERTARLRTLRDLARTLTASHPRASWVSPHAWEMNGSLFGVAFRGEESNALSRRLFEEHGFVFRPFNTQGLNSVRLSPNVFTGEDALVRFFDLATRA